MTLNNQEQWTNYGICSNCGRCCSDILPLDDKEIDEIFKYIDKHNVKK